MKKLIALIALAASVSTFTSVPRSFCLRFLPDNFPAFKACMNGDYDSPATPAAPVSGN